MPILFPHHPYNNLSLERQPKSSATFKPPTSWLLSVAFPNCCCSIHFVVSQTILQEKVNMLYKLLVGCIPLLEGEAASSVTSFTLFAADLIKSESSLPQLLVLLMAAPLPWLQTFAFGSPTANASTHTPTLLVRSAFYLIIETRCGTMSFRLS